MGGGGMRNLLQLWRGGYKEVIAAVERWVGGV